MNQLTAKISSIIFTYTLRTPNDFPNVAKKIIKPSHNKYGTQKYDTTWLMNPALSSSTSIFAGTAINFVQSLTLTVDVKVTLSKFSLKSYLNKIT